LRKPLCNRKKGLRGGDGNVVVWRIGFARRERRETVGPGTIAIDVRRRSLREGKRRHKVASKTGEEIE
jgi:hypothetical protein